MFEILLLFRCKGQINKVYLPSLLKTTPNSIQKKKKKKKNGAALLKLLLQWWASVGIQEAIPGFFKIDCWVISEIMHHIAPNSANENAYIAPM